MKYILILIPFLLFGRSLTPNREFKTNGQVYDFIISDNKIYSATANGEIDVFSLKSGKLETKISLPPLENFYGEKIPAKLYTVDKFQNQILILSEAKFGGRAIFIKKDGKLNKILESKSPIKKVRFINDVLFLYATLGNELILYNILDKKEIYRVQVNSSPFSDFSINKYEVAVSCESGDISIHNIWTGEILKTLKGENLDNVYKVAYKNGVVVGAGQDRKASVYKIDGKSFHKDANFLIYAIGLSEDGKISAFPHNEENDITVFETETGNILYELKGQRATLNTIIFVDDETLITSSDDDTILEWKLK